MVTDTTGRSLDRHQCGSAIEDLQNNITFDCFSQTHQIYPVARYISIIKTGKGENSGTLWLPSGMIICEVIIIGHKYIPVSLDKCENDDNDGAIASDNAIWCSRCKPGWMPPDCKHRCLPGYYGENCNNTCTMDMINSIEYYGYHCDKYCQDINSSGENDEEDNQADCMKNDKSCRYCINTTECVLNLRCVSCQIWYTGNLCELHIDLPEIQNLVSIIETRNTSIFAELHFHQGIPFNLTEYYNYYLNYKLENSDHVTRSKIPYIHIAEKLTIKLIDLTFNSSYIIFIELCRSNRDQSTCTSSVITKFQTRMMKFQHSTPVNSYPTTHKPVSLVTNTKGPKVSFSVATVIGVSVMGSLIVFVAAVSACLEIQNKKQKHIDDPITLVTTII